LEQEHTVFLSILSLPPITAKTDPNSIIRRMARNRLAAMIACVDRSRTSSLLLNWLIFEPEISQGTSSSLGNSYQQT
jgi:hypothetical protein